MSSQKFKVGDVVIHADPDIPSRHKGKGVVTAVRNETSCQDPDCTLCAPNYTYWVQWYDRPAHDLVPYCGDNLELLVKNEVTIEVVK